MKILFPVLWFMLLSLNIAAQNLINSESLKIIPGNSSYVARLIPNRQTAFCGDESGKPDGDIRAVTITILDKKTGKRIVNGKKEDLRLYENNIERKIVSLSPLDSLINVYILVDVSLSIGGRLEELSKTANAFIGNLRSNDRFSAISFDGKIKELRKLTNASDVPVKNGVLQTRHQGTSLYDAVDLVLNKRIVKSPERHIIILFTDGVDSTSSKKAKDNFRAAQETEAVIYPLQYSYTSHFDPYYSRAKTIMNALGDLKQQKKLSYSESEDVKFALKLDKKQASADNYLQELARLTGGNVYPAENIENLNQAFSSILEEVRSQYILCYSSRATN